MMRARLACLKHISYAMLALVALVCAIEVGLRGYVCYTGKASLAPTSEVIELAHSEFVHHGLRSLDSQLVPNPDSGQLVELRTNSFGLRGSEIAVPKPTGVYRIICLGDEGTLAPGIEEQETFCNRLQQLLQDRTPLKVEVLNAGVPGYCPLLSYLQVRHSLLALQPDLLILNFDMSDVADDHRYRRHAMMSASGIPLACAHPLLRSPVAETHKRLLDSFLISKWCLRQLGSVPEGVNGSGDLRDIDSPQGRYAWLKENPPNWSVYIRQALSPIENLSQVANGVYARMVVATYPAPWQVSGKASNSPSLRARVGIPPNALLSSRRPFEMLGAATRQWKIGFCDASQAFSDLENPERLYQQNAPRFSRLGHELYARELAKFLLINIPSVWTNDSFDGRSQPIPRHAFSGRR